MVIVGLLTTYLLLGILSHVLWNSEFERRPGIFVTLQEILLWPLGWYYFVKAI